MNSTNGATGRLSKQPVKSASGRLPGQSSIQSLLPRTNNNKQNAPPSSQAIAKRTSAATTTTKHLQTPSGATKRGPQTDQSPSEGQHIRKNVRESEAADIDENSPPNPPAGPSPDPTTENPHPADDEMEPQPNDNSSAPDTLHTADAEPPMGDSSTDETAADDDTLDSQPVTQPPVPQAAKTYSQAAAGGAAAPAPSAQPQHQRPYSNAIDRAYCTDMDTPTILIAVPKDQAKKVRVAFQSILKNNDGRITQQFPKDSSSELVFYELNGRKDNEAFLERLVDVAKSIKVTVGDKEAPLAYSHVYPHGMRPYVAFYKLLSHKANDNEILAAAMSETAGKLKVSSIAPIVTEEGIATNFFSITFVSDTESPVHDYDPPQVIDGQAATLQRVTKDLKHAFSTQVYDDHQRRVAKVLSRQTRQQLQESNQFPLEHRPWTPRSRACIQCDGQHYDADCPLGRLRHRQWPTTIAKKAQAQASAAAAATAAAPATPEPATFESSVALDEQLEVQHADQQPRQLHSTNSLASTSAAGAAAAAALIQTAAAAANVDSFEQDDAPMLISPSSLVQVDSSREIQRSRSASSPERDNFVWANAAASRSYHAMALTPTMAIPPPAPHPFLSSLLLSGESVQATVTPISRVRRDPSNHSPFKIEPGSVVGEDQIRLLLKSEESGAKAEITAKIHPSLPKPLKEGGFVLFHKLD
ncbi:hypothetical protein GQ42DRAFT_177636 [Ramicandelaber brevisporus]|nr:hypothetical protein GQ42DRAFT_177636 [Ramicandelaber brevisporus]